MVRRKTLVGISNTVGRDGRSPTVSEVYNQGLLHGRAEGKAEAKVDAELAIAYADGRRALMETVCRRVAQTMDLSPSLRNMAKRALDK